jgi:hypothetical protein
LNKKQTFIRIPSDFKSLHDLADLVSNYDLLSRLSEALLSYQMHYLQSYFMTLDEVLSYIPEKQQSGYGLWIHDDKFTIGNSIGWKKPGLTLVSMLKAATKCGDNDKLFLVDTIGKYVVACYWNLTKTIIPRSIDDEGPRYKELGFHLNDKKILEVKANYEITAHQAVGGSWINGRTRGYLAHHTYAPYTLKGYDLHHFCTRTNKYMGYIDSIEEKRREWLDTSSKGRY